jgi:hypothetical protein
LNIKILSLTNNKYTFLDLSSGISTGGERGLLGLAFHPNYTTNGWVFCYSYLGQRNTNLRYSVSANANIASSTGTILMTIHNHFSNHNGCPRLVLRMVIYISLAMAERKRSWK